MRTGETIIIAAALLLVGCGTSPAYRSHARVPEGGIRVVPASAEGCGERAPRTCQCDDDVVDDDDADGRPRSKPVEYVKIQQWQAPVAVQEFEAENPPRGNTPAKYTEFPQLTRHNPNPGPDYSVWGGPTRWRSRYVR